ncbi:dihydrolipoyl dehydrogenase [Algisphaera agarilytica]|uniref:Dihydrolipoyl dehydrogenase n=1 Tax=Algisphaera agarilytica TaxID=1385975 RepID=A0A7X0H4T2_9BACT|nr:dihydrolipoyl dehydrogenase [Algisphaera agarilytica]MBB6429266.1 dihydrolipoamide dehydrogenase [Algisphaera agarilytica]
MAEHTHDLLVIGAGPAGYVAAIRAAQLGLDVACVDKGQVAGKAAMGGTCLRVGCIPSKALLESSEKYEDAMHHFADHGIEVGSVKLDLEKMLERKDGVVKALTGGISALFKKNKVKAYHGSASFNADKTVTVGDDTITAEHVLIATGSVPASLPGIDLSQDLVDTSTDAIDYQKVPKKLVVIGAGVIGLELGSVWRRLGSEVVVLEYLDRIFPGMDDELAKEALKIFKKQGLKFELGSKVTGVKTTKKGVVIERDGADPVEADRVLVAVGRKPNTEGLGLENIGITPNARGQIEIEPGTFKTSVPGVYAVGDVVPGPMLAHKAEEEGVACVEIIATGHGHIDYNTVPGVVYTHPEIASVGKSEEELKAEGIAYNKGKFPFMANGRARAIEEVNGFVKVLADKETDRVLGVHILGQSAGDLIAECATAMAFGASSEDIARACHAHPTLNEAVKEAALGVAGRAIHI